MSTNSSDMASPQEQIQQPVLGCLHPNPDGTITYVAQQPGDLRLFFEALRVNPRLVGATTSLRLSADSDGMAASGVLQFAEDLRVEYGIGVSDDDVSRSSTMTERNTNVRQNEATQDEDEDQDENEDLEMADDGGSDSDTTIILEDAEPEDVEAPDTSEDNKENVPEVTPVSPPVSTAEPTPSPPPEALDPFRRAVEDFEALKVAACVEPDEEVPLPLYLGLVRALLSMCSKVTTVI
jgi:hypothetical protein